MNVRDHSQLERNTAPYRKSASEDSVESRIWHMYIESRIISNFKKMTLLYVNTPLADYP